MKWEYRELLYVRDGVQWTWSDVSAGVDGTPLVQKLNQLGAEGWEYIEVRDRDEFTKVYLFKRLLEK